MTQKRHQSQDLKMPGSSTNYPCSGMHIPRHDQGAQIESQLGLLTQFRSLRHILAM